MTMRNRKAVIVAFMLIACMLMAVGFAALTDTLTIIGNAHIDIAAAENNFDEKIFFSASQAVSSTGTGTTNDTASHTADDATFTVNKLAVKDQKSIFKFTIKNESNVAADITVEPTKLSGAANPSNSNTAIFGITYEYAVFDAEGVQQADNDTIPSGGTMDVTVTVSVIAPVTSNTSATFGIEYTATTVE